MIQNTSTKKTLILIKDLLASLLEYIEREKIRKVKSVHLFREKNSEEKKIQVTQQLRMSSALNDIGV